MKNQGKFLAVYILIFCIFSVSCLAKLDYNRQGLDINSIHRILKLDDNQIDLATAVLLASRDWNGYTNTRIYRDKIDEMAEYILETATKRAGKPDGITLVRRINSYLFDELKYTAVTDANNPEDLFLHSVIDNRRGYCLSLSVLYLSIGQRLGLPLYGVVVPGHFFVRYDDGKTQFNIETTSNGNFAPDEHYIKTFNVPKNGYENLYMKNLTNQQTIGCFFNNLGNCYQSAGQTDKALEIFKNAIELNPTLTESLSNLGNIYMQQMDYPQAMLYFQKALKINPDDSKVHLNIGNVYLCQDNPTWAIIELKKAIAYDPKLSPAYLSLARAYRMKELYNAAIDSLTRGTQLSSGAEWWREFALVYSATGEYKIAEDYFNRAIQAKECWAEIYFDLGILYGMTMEKDKEIQAYKDAIVCNPEMTAAMQNLGNVYLKNEDYDAALEIFTRAIESDPKNSAFYFGIGLVYAQRKDYSEAEKYYIKTLKLDRTNKSAYYNLAVCYYNMENYNLAYENAVKAQELGFDLPEGLLKELQRMKK
jgi:tetratricopeptide (TPR) repeat protein